MHVQNMYYIKSLIQKKYHVNEPSRPIYWSNYVKDIKRPDKYKQKRELKNSSCAFRKEK